ncbi:hypothetical protein SAMN05660742_11916 [Propionispira arboris]|uniref:Uncharacterized protein n=1 Tax=Propionispira arboris TaxID=84035 RepID=A0A1H7C2B1_9FIRM|nr:hypothetical protein [Propionispira arboris]SEJ83821.1 hypothetical protein SAMN05660742_11916 [Propionispira arboris]
MIEFYLSFNFKEGGDKHPPKIANTIRKCLFDNQIITSGRQFHLYVDAERHNLDKNKNCQTKGCLTKSVRMNFLCKVDTDPDLPPYELTLLNLLLEPAFKILSKQCGLDNFKIRKI